MHIRAKVRGDDPEAGRRSPVVIRDRMGSVSAGLCIDHAICRDDILVASGWVIGAREVNFLDESDKAIETLDVAIDYFERPDVVDGYAVPAGTEVRGFLAIFKFGLRPALLWTGRRFADAQVSILFEPFYQDRPEELRMLIDANIDRKGFLLQHTLKSKLFAAAITARLTPPPVSYMTARGHLEQARGVVGVGGLVVGWSICTRSASVCLVDTAGFTAPISGASRWNRPDIVDGFSNTFGSDVQNAGFLQGWHASLTIGGKLQMVVIDGVNAYILSECQWTAAPVEPVSFARWSFDLPTPLSGFQHRLEHHDGPVLQKLTERKNKAQRDMKPRTMVFGTQPENPVCSIIIPLYGRHDFMLNQLLEFGDDPYISKSCEIIYVVDDPRILDAVIGESPLLADANQIGFKVIDGVVNRGFSGANNLAAEHGKAPYILLLNSDVIPVESGWVEKLIESLEANPRPGIVGARLLYANGSLQHDGMECWWSTKWDAFLKKHTSAGLEPPAASAAAVSRMAVTAACLLISRETWAAVDGLYEGYLIGDFEDTDLCFKVRSKGLDVHCRQDVSLVHLERQSFKGIGGGPFREQVARYNAWVHQCRWGAAIAAYQKQNAAESAA
jgi:O-antigen biosynthesis protein